MYSLKRNSDGAGCIGNHSHSVKINQPESKNIIVSVRPIVGCSMIVLDSFYSWWQTTEIVEILEDHSDLVRFKTLNSEYEWTIIE